MLQVGVNGFWGTPYRPGFPTLLDSPYLQIPTEHRRYMCPHVALAQATGEATTTGRDLAMTSMEEDGKVGSPSPTETPEARETWSVWGGCDGTEGASGTDGWGGSCDECVAQPIC
jgi:hypothetical protein